MYAVREVPGGAEVEDQVAPVVEPVQARRLDVAHRSGLNIISRRAGVTGAVRPIDDVLSTQHIIEGGHGLQCSIRTCDDRVADHGVVAPRNGVQHVVGTGTDGTPEDNIIAAGRAVDDAILPRSDAAAVVVDVAGEPGVRGLSLIHISEPTRLL